MKALVLSLLCLTACAPEQVDRERWLQMSQDDRVLYVRALIGEEQAKAAKGGGGRHVPRAPEHYVTAIDAAYANGDTRPPAAIFAKLR